MSSVAYTYTFYRPIPINLKVSQSSSRFCHIAKPIHYQKKTKFDPSCHTLNTLKHPN